MQCDSDMDSDKDVFSVLWDFPSPDLEEFPQTTQKKNKKNKQKSPGANERTHQEVLQQEYLYLAELEKNLAQIVKSKEGMSYVNQGFA